MSEQQMPKDPAQLEQLIALLQQNEVTRKNEAASSKSNTFAIVMFAISVLINGIVLKYFTWATDQIYTLMNRVEVHDIKLNAHEERSKNQFEELNRRIENHLNNHPPK